MPIFTGVRRFFTGRKPVELTVDATGQTVVDEPTQDRDPDTASELTPEGVLAPVVDPVATIERLESTLQSGRDVQDRTLEAIKRVPHAVAEIERIANGQKDLADAIRSLEAAGDQRTKAESAVLERLSDLIEREGALFGLVQNQLDANQQAVEKTATRLEEVASAIHETARTNRATGEAMEAMVSEIRDREQRAEHRAGALQGWVVTCVVACIAATAASLALAWSVIGSSN